MYLASSAYAAAPIGDVFGMMLELMTHGPLEATFIVYTDFHLYSHGVYERSHLGKRVSGHAVKLIGWGVAQPGEPGLENASAPVPYWTVLNSWSPNWGEAGFFRIRRGTNEALIETMPAAGLPLVE